MGNVKDFHSTVEGGAQTPADLVKHAADNGGKCYGFFKDVSGTVASVLKGRKGGGVKIPLDLAFFHASLQHTAKDVIQGLCVLMHGSGRRGYGGGGGWVGATGWGCGVPFTFD